MKKIIVIGGTSGMGRSIAALYAAGQNQVSVTGRRMELLDELQTQFPAIQTACFDIMGDNVIQQLQLLIEKSGGADLIIISAGGGEPSEDLDWKLDEWTVQLNVNAFVKIANWAFHFFNQQGHGQLACISSIAANRGNAAAPAYSAAKAFQSTYMEGLSIKATKLNKPIYFTCIEPGFVNTKMAKSKKLFWVVPVEKAARQIINAIEHKKRKVYISKRWRLIAWLAKNLPYVVYKRLG
ncbi:MAG TPA: SDR family NAD(P)-dependent oxidoreductase [Chitinophagaceae bacterium]|jgi:Short-chain dehydrogenases of various substrate specificities